MRQACATALAQELSHAIKAMTQRSCRMVGICLFTTGWTASINNGIDYTFGLSLSPLIIFKFL